jgi:hypothetical protein
LSEPIGGMGGIRHESTRGVRGLKRSPGGRGKGVRHHFLMVVLF